MKTQQQNFDDLVREGQYPIRVINKEDNLNKSINFDEYPEASYVIECNGYTIDDDGFIHILNSSYIIFYYNTDGVEVGWHYVDVE
jgi:hypothetical protein